ncbi:concanavalin A-like lectin/glucanase [Eremomyces bilateralis CBS 781.70]|uniref:Concanavalin A-like lectin/glucanase n=1 Tax=Eremomyces bilateralis CBS 781.70 TaxID=1392243 RepID=A0A6G1GDP2_9PEZI|nr:concanavalin A-like lectin/glucanase [Eremomyces bilateralis CBS 781.70]KAF1816142.1 concanavalin A-like lectin/glucanase [Eremomyces bilateralis CBS 781.70]
MYITTLFLLALHSLLPPASAATIIDNLSFGHKGDLSPDRRSLPGWRVTGEGHTPPILSDRIILTPPAPGNRRGALWTDATNTRAEWTAEAHFRATGPERGGGNFQLWYARDGAAAVGLASLYTVDKFDGLVVVVDQYGGHGGTVRGFLNDGTKSFRDQQNVDSLAFGMCTFPYRNQGAFLGLKVVQTRDVFEVEIHGKSCFKSTHVGLPSGNQFGFTAGSAENPDSFEIAQFLVSDTPSAAPPPSNDRRSVEHDASNGKPNDASSWWDWKDSQNSPASAFRTEEQRFSDLHDRLTTINHDMTILYDALLKLEKQISDQSGRVFDEVSSVHRRVDALEREVGRGNVGKLGKIEGIVERVQREVEGKDYKEILDKIHAALHESHATLMYSLPAHMSQSISAASPRMGFFLFIVIVFQIMLAASYFVYKKRKNAMPKKYL